ncbi:class I SAM-dependent methyltransferase [Alteromonadaceae bacterium M269]|nr:class I SAM-dependent methyltransferase [Alteromonadaceae bacterium M269]
MKAIEKERSTIEHYSANAESFWEGTKDHDVSQNVEAFLAALPQNRALNILDFGCGPGRDLATFKSLGHNPVGLDGSAEFCRMAEQYSGCRTLNQNFVDADLALGSYDGVFANASLFHVPKENLLHVLCHLNQALVDDGILFMSNPRGSSEEWLGARYGHYMELEVISSFLTQAGFTVLNHYYRPTDAPPELQRWLAVVSQKSSSPNGVSI